ncbi:hypothetical protein [Halochromatium salexigens]|uniref:Lipoprotein n=1 Tax=Halochromatium salexigens TaxID=49447 RepID=A0AAJ0UH74_HALSE|nr:hypothetical protein [Halochromatium salexigens]
MNTLPAPLALLALLPLLLASCATTGNLVSDWGEITLAPGDTGVCHSNPCRVFFKMPPGAGTYALRGSAFPIGEYPAGNTAMIGSFFESSVIEIVGTDLPKTYLTVPESGGDAR